MSTTNCHNQHNINDVDEYDGIGGYLPAEILDALEAEGFNVDDMRPDED